MTDIFVGIKNLAIADVARIAGSHQGLIRLGSGTV
jgi:hypothetical protein